MIAERSAQAKPALPMYTVCWSSVVSSCSGRSRPLSKDVAEFMLHDETLAHPLRQYWIEQCAAEDRMQPRRDGSPAGRPGEAANYLQ